jgi:hypothetical protein
MLLDQFVVSVTDVNYEKQPPALDQVRYSSS